MMKRDADLLDSLIDIERLEEVQRKLKLVEVKLYGSELHALVDTAANPHTVPLCQLEQLGVRLTANRRRITVADSKKATTYGCPRRVTVTIDSLTVPPNFAILAGSSLEFIRDRLAVEKLCKVFDTCRQMARVRISVIRGAIQIVLLLVMEDGKEPSEEEREFTSSSKKKYGEPYDAESSDEDVAGVDKTKRYGEVREDTF